MIITKENSSVSISSFYDQSLDFVSLISKWILTHNPSVAPNIVLIFCDFT